MTSLWGARLPRAWGQVQKPTKLKIKKKWELVGLKIYQPHQADTEDQPSAVLQLWDDQMRTTWDQQSHQCFGLRALWALISQKVTHRVQVEASQANPPSCKKSRWVCQTQLLTSSHPKRCLATNTVQAQSHLSSELITKTIASCPPIVYSLVLPAQQLSWVLRSKKRPEK